MANTILELNCVPVGQDHRYIHGSDGEYKVKERVAVQRSKSFIVFVIDIAIYFIIIIVLIFIILVLYKRMNKQIVKQYT